MNNIELLYKLQGIDDRRREVEKKVEELSNSEEVNVNRSDLVKREEILVKEKSKLGEVKKRAKDIEFKDEQLLNKEKDYKEQLYSGEVSNPKELEKLQDKLKMVDERKSKIEEELLELMMEIEVKENELVIDEEEIGKTKKEAEESETVKAAEKKVCNKELEILIEEKAEVEELLEEELISSYNSLYKKKSYKAVVKLEDGYCMGCRMSLPSNQVKEVKDNDGIVLCDNCGRMLYYLE